jgi:hypothetical protein
MHGASRFILLVVYITVVHSISSQNFADANIFSQRLTVPVVDQFIADLKDSVDSVKGQPTGKGSMVTLYGS